MKAWLVLVIGAALLAANAPAQELLPSSPSLGDVESVGNVVVVAGHDGTDPIALKTQVEERLLQHGLAVDWPYSGPSPELLVEISRVHYKFRRDRCAGRAPEYVAYDITVRFREPVHLARRPEESFLATAWVSSSRLSAGSEIPPEPVGESVNALLGQFLTTVLRDRQREAQ